MRALLLGLVAAVVGCGGGSSAPHFCGFGTMRARDVCVPASSGTRNGSFTTTTTWSKNLQISEAGLDVAAEPSMAVNSMGLIVVAAIAVRHYDPNEPTADIRIWRSTDGGKSFETVHTYEATPGRILGDPTVLFDGRDRLIVAFADWDALGTVGDVKVVRSTDGKIFGDPEIVDSEDSNVLRDRPWLSLAPDGSAVLSWAVYRDHSVGARRAVSKDGGPFMAAETIVAGTGEYLGSPIAFAPDGTAVAITDLAGRLIARRNRGTGWSSEQVFDFYGDPDPSPQVQWTKTGGFTIVFLAPPSYAVSAYVIRSTDRGRSWSAAEPIGGSVGDSSAVLPWLTTDDRGRLHLMWLDNRSGGWVPYTSISEDGLHFREAERIGDATFVEDGEFKRWIGDFNTIVARGPTRYAVWSDSRNGRSAIYFASAPEAP